jgi:hypothetical protein
MQGRHASLSSLRPPQSLAINRNQFRIGRLLRRLRPLQKPGGELIPLEQLEHTAKCLVQRDPVGQFKELPLPSLADLPEEFNIRPVLDSTDHRQTDNRQDIIQLVISPTHHLRISHTLEALSNPLDNLILVVHDRPPHLAGDPRTHPTAQSCSPICRKLPPQRSFGQDLGA